MDRLDFQDKSAENSDEEELKEVSRQDGSHSVWADFLGTLGFPNHQAENEEKTIDRSAFENTSAEIPETEQAGRAPHDVYDDYIDENGAISAPHPMTPDSMPESPPVHRKKINKSAVAAVLFIVAALVLSALRYAWPRISEPSPPNPDVAAVYGGKYILIDDLKEFMNTEGLREREHAFCKIHGFDHAKCDPSEPCEVHPIDTLEGYRALITRYAVEQSILEWAGRKEVTSRESVRHGIKDIMADASVMNTISQLHLKELSPESISKWDVQQYYDANSFSYGDKEFSAVEAEIRNILAKKKHENFLPDYIEGLKKAAGLEVNFDLLRVTEPSESDIRAFYDKNIAEYRTPERAEIKEIVFDSRETADKAARMLGSGASFETVAAEYGRDGTPQARIIDNGIGLSEMNAAIWQMAEGETSAILTDIDGSARMVRLIRKIPPGARALSDV
ncbi:MAG: peptidyl-prolyl cis-trans isomerase, partial [Synergistaceae bacterium]|nr:peptidyl-prolyl cis-trans isomerase [Synergistaceae bacterium]